MAHVHMTWLAGSASSATTRQHHGIIAVDLPDDITIGAVEGEHADSLARTLITLGRQVLALNGTSQDDVAVLEFVEQEDLRPELLPTLRRLVAYVDGVRAEALNELVLAEVDQ